MKNKLQQAMVLSGCFSRFFHHAACSGIVLLLFALAAMMLANSPWAMVYELGLHMPLRIVGLELSVLYWVNDGLMAIFFFVIGLEIKREFVFGELHSLSAMTLPIVAALGGMVMPAVLYGLLNFDSPTIAGWGIPMATDIAFSLGLLANAGLPLGDIQLQEFSSPVTLGIIVGLCIGRWAFLAVSTCCARMVLRYCLIELGTLRWPELACSEELGLGCLCLLHRWHLKIRHT